MNADHSTAPMSAHSKAHQAHVPSTPSAPVSPNRGYVPPCRRSESSSDDERSVTAAAPPPGPPRSVFGSGFRKKTYAAEVPRIGGDNVYIHHCDCKPGTTLQRGVWLTFRRIPPNKKRQVTVGVQGEQYNPSEGPIPQGRFRGVIVSVGLDKHQAWFAYVSPSDQVTMDAKERAQQKAEADMRAKVDEAVEKAREDVDKALQQKRQEHEQLTEELRLLSQRSLPSTVAKVAARPNPLGAPAASQSSNKGVYVAPSNRIQAPAVTAPQVAAFARTSKRTSANPPHRLTDGIFIHEFECAYRTRLEEGVMLIFTKKPPSQFPYHQGIDAAEFNPLWESVPVGRTLGVIGAVRTDENGSQYVFVTEDATAIEEAKRRAKLEADAATKAEIDKAVGQVWRDANDEIQELQRKNEELAVQVKVLKAEAGAALLSAAKRK